MKTLSIVIPAYNERQTLLEIVKRVCSVELPLCREVIVVDDGSTDGTAELAAELAQAWKEGGGPRLLRRLGEPAAHSPVGFQVILQPQNYGKGAALRAGFGAATGELVLVQDADLEYDPRDYGLLLRPLLEGRADVVFGSRFLATERRVLFFWHSVGNTLLTLLSNAMTDLNLTDMETGYKVFRREILEQIRIQSEGFGVEPELTAKVGRLHCRVYEVPISYAGRSYAEGKKITWKDGVEALWCIARFGPLARVADRLRSAAGLVPPAQKT
ncbi:MAG TPA: glycosyltransferase family 2 protein [Myxococcota bacterium]|nr:glycosyltransferase family 2 protein [Myxococcota bacterium]